MESKVPVPWLPMSLKCVQLIWQFHRWLVMTVQVKSIFFLSIHKFVLGRDVFILLLMGSIKMVGYRASRLLKDPHR